jgi:hypothetical protein
VMYVLAELFSIWKAKDDNSDCVMAALVEMFLKTGYFLAFRDKQAYKIVLKFIYYFIYLLL